MEQDTYLPIHLKRQLAQGLSHLRGDDLFSGHPFIGQTFKDGKLMFFQTAGIAADISDSCSLRNIFLSATTPPSFFTISKKNILQKDG
jgi:hypothetical protein